MCALCSSCLFCGCRTAVLVGLVALLDLYLLHNLVWGVGGFWVGSVAHFICSCLCITNLALLHGACIRVGP